jgi:excisionase family DNA binding protein
MNKNFFTTEEVAEYTGLAPGTVRNKVWKRELPAYRLGNKLRFKVEDVDEWLSNKLVRK